MHWLLRMRKARLRPVIPLPTRSFFTSTEERLRLEAKMAPCSSAPLAPTWHTINKR